MLRVEGIRRSFGRTTPLKSASLWAESGKVTTLMGRNGSGKTTLMRVAAGLLRPDQGIVTFLGDVVDRPSLPALARRGLMYLPEQRLVVPAVTVRDHFRALASVFGAVALAAAIDICRLDPLMDQRIVTLSGGEKARVSLGLAYAREPVVLLADEPLAGLAPRDQGELGGVLRAMASRGGAVVTSGHDTAVLLEHSDVVLWSVAGTTHHLGTPDEALRHHQFRSEYLALEALDEGDERGGPG